MYSYHNVASLRTVDYLYQREVLFEIHDIKAGTQGHVYQGILRWRTVYDITSVGLDHLTFITEGRGNYKAGYLFPEDRANWP